MLCTKCQPFCLGLNGLTSMYHFVFTKEVYPSCWGMVYLGQGLTYPIADGPGQVKLPVRQVGDLSFPLYILYKQLEKMHNSESWPGEKYWICQALFGTNQLNTVPADDLAACISWS